MRLATIALVLLSAGCGRVNFDNGSSDGGPAIDFGPTGDVTVVVLRGGEPQQGITIIFQNPDGSVIDYAPTDGFGEVVGQIPDGGMITMADNANRYFDGTYYSLVTVQGVSRGERVQLGSNIDPWDGMGNLRVTLPGAVVNAVNYGILAGCGSASLSNPASVATVSLSYACSIAGTPSLIAYAYDATGATLQETRFEDVALDVDGTTDVVMPAWTDLTWETIALNVTGLPADANTTQLYMKSILDGVLFGQDGDSTGVSDGASTAAVDIPANFSQGFQYKVRVDRTGPDGISDNRWERVVNRTAKTSVINLDMSGEAMPMIPTVDVDLANASRPRLLFTPVGDVSGFDAAHAVLEWEDENLDRYEWLFLFPPGLTEVEAPALPKFLANYPPTVTSAVTANRVALFDADFVDGYSEYVQGYAFNIIENELFDAPAGDWSLTMISGPSGFY